MEQIVELAAPHFRNPEAVVSAHVGYCDTLYMAHDAHGLASCFFVAWEGDVVGSRMQTAFLGLSAARPDHQGKSTTVRLYNSFITEARERVAQGQPPVLCWCTSASLTVIPLFMRLIGDTQPKADLTCDADRKTDLVIAMGRLAARKALSVASLAESSDPHYPFVFRGLSSIGAFSDSEEQRQNSRRARRDVALLGELDLQSSTGDRMLLTGRIS